MSLIPIAAELWKGPRLSSGADDGYAIVVTRADVGTYTVWVGLVDTSSEVFTGLDNLYKAKCLNVGAVDAFLLAQEPADAEPWGNRQSLEAVGLHPHRPEFAMEKAALKTARRLLSRKSRAAQTPQGWEPLPGWEQHYKGRLSFTSYDSNARWHQLEADIEVLRQKIADMEPSSDFAESDEDFRARRMAKIQLKQKLREIESREAK